jgi:hypothetical protein
VYDDDIKETICELQDLKQQINENFCYETLQDLRRFIKWRLYGMSHNKDLIDFTEYYSDIPLKITASVIFDQITKRYKCIIKNLKWLNPKEETIELLELPLTGKSDKLKDITFNSNDFKIDQNTILVMDYEDNIMRELNEIFISTQKKLITLLQMINKLSEIEKVLENLNKIDDIYSNTHWIIRVGDGINFKNSQSNKIWGFRDINGQKTILEKFNEGDILWFITSKPYGGKVVGMAEFVKLYDRKNEFLIPINTFSNEENGWSGNIDWDLQITYKNLYNTEAQNISLVVKFAGNIMNYGSFKKYIDLDLDVIYKNYVTYAEIVN